MNTETSHRAPSFGLSLIPIIILIALLGLNVFVYSDNATYGPNQIALIFATAIASIIGFRLKYSWGEILDGIVRSIKTALPAVLILLIIGALSGTWKQSGVVPAMIYYGLDILHPKIFLVAACLISAIISIATGSSWTTTATIGVAFIGIGDSMGISSGITAGAVISGAYFGDKMSPLSDTTNLAPAMAGTDLFTHIRYMAITTIPTFIITLILFTIIGFSSTGVISDESVNDIQSIITKHYTISPILFLVPVVVLVLILKKVDAVPALLIGTVVGGLFMIFMQPESVMNASSYAPKEAHAYDGMIHSYSAMTTSMFGEVKVITENDDISSLLTSSGMEGMLNTIWLIVCAMCFGGVMEITGMLKRISDTLISFAKSTGSLIATTVGTCLFFNGTASDQYLAIVVPGRMYADTYRERGLKPENLSRTLEDSGTVTSVLFSWNTCGAYQSGILNVATGDYFLYCFFNYLSPVMTLLVGYTGFKIRKYTDEEMKALEKIDPIDL